jgi:hypothetical protein
MRKQQKEHVFRIQTQEEGYRWDNGKNWGCTYTSRKPRWIKNYSFSSSYLQGEEQYVQAYVQLIQDPIRNTTVSTPERVSNVEERELSDSKNVIKVDKGKLIAKLQETERLLRALK